jgi:hypothetical protein
MKNRVILAIAIIAIILLLTRLVGGSSKHFFALSLICYGFLIGYIGGWVSANHFYSKKRLQ